MLVRAAVHVLNYGRWTARCEDPSPPSAKPIDHEVRQRGHARLDSHVKQYSDAHLEQCGEDGLRA